MNKNIAIGLTSPFGSGGRTASIFLKEEHGFSIFSLTDRIKEIIEKRKIEGEIVKPKRKDYQDVGDELRKKNGNDYLARDKFNQVDFSKHKKIVFKSIRNPHEAKFFEKKIKNFFLINIDAPQDIRIKRVFKDKDKAPSSEEEFYRDDERDSGKSQPEHGQNIRGCVDFSDIVINNESAKKDLSENIKKYLYLMQHPKEDIPEPMELNMAHAYRCSLNSTCLNRKVGSVIVNDTQIIASGYNDVPEKIKSCKFLNYCFRKDAMKCTNTACDEDIIEIKDVCKCGINLNDEQKEILGKHLDLCQAIHAEEKAILQVAKLGGQSLKNSILYSTTFPCLMCAKKIIEVKIKEVVYLEPYPYSKAYEILNKANIKLIKFQGVKSKTLDKLY